MPRSLLATLAAVLLLASCAERRPAAWRLVPQDRGHRLIPPRPNPEDPAFQLRRARTPSRKNPACLLDKPGIRLRWKGRDAQVRADSASLSAIPGTLLEGAGGGAPALQPAVGVLSANWYSGSLQPSLLAQQQAGCLTPADAPQLERRILDHLILPTSHAYRLLYGEYAMLGFIDIDARFRLRAVEPIRQQGVAVGYLTSFYLLQPAPSGGVTVAPHSSESNVKSVITHGPAPDHPLLHLPPHATHLRFFFRTFSTTDDRRIALLAAPSAVALNQAATAFEADPEGYCAAPTQGTACIAVPKDTIIGPELRIRAQGREEYVPVAGNVADLLRSLNVRNPASVLPTLQIHREYEGRFLPIQFDRTNPAILGFVFLGGEQVTW
ncbi:MAG: hypothetical protein HY821_25675 [Acidobacteria bacterium]|nr:hypothetical protein [Acidobacteriota bacterium]